MQSNSIFQFVGFETSVVLEGFIPQWENYAKRVFKKDIHAISLQQQVASSNRYKYISRNEWPQENFRFSFMEGRLSTHFPDHKVKVVQAGGYSALQLDCENRPEQAEVSVLVFIGDLTVNLDDCRKLPHLFMNIYEAYYQSCLYTFILEYFIGEDDAGQLLAELKKQFANTEIGIYKECLVLED